MKKRIHLLALILGIGAAFAFNTMKKGLGDLYYLDAGGHCLLSHCESVNNSNVPCDINVLYSNNTCTQRYVGNAWQTVDGK